MSPNTTRDSDGHSPRRMVIKLLAAITMVGLAGCSDQASVAPTSSVTLRLSDSVDLEKVLRADEQANLTYKLPLARSGTIYFGELNTYDDDEQVLTSAPIIARKTGERWRALRIDDARLTNAAWMLVAAGPRRGEIWAVLDQSVGDPDEPQSEILVAHSADAGQTFSLTALRKPDPSAAFDSLCIGPDGHGRLTVYLAADDESVKHRAGYYYFRTTDMGQSWTHGTYEPDALVVARDVSDEEQPDVQSPIHTASFKHK